MSYWAVSDLNSSELQEIRPLVQNHTMELRESAAGVDQGRHTLTKLNHLPLLHGELALPSDLLVWSNQLR